MTATTITLLALAPVALWLPVSGASNRHRESRIDADSGGIP